MEHRAKYLILAIIILTFINIAEVFMIGGEERSLLTDTEIKDRLNEIERRYFEIDNEIADIHSRLEDGDINSAEYLQQVVPLLDEQKQLQAKASMLIFYRTEDRTKNQISFGSVIIGFFTISIEDAPDPINIVLSLVNTILLLISTLLIVSFIYDFVKALPLT